MPEPDGTLDPQERERFDVWLARYWEDPDCPICGSKDWSRAEKVHQIINTATLGPEGTSYPAVSFMCQVCGYTILVNSIGAGITMPDDAEAGET